jgi:uncharacterized protein (TIGR01244 family)
VAIDRRNLALAALAYCWCAAALAQSLVAPNVVPISPTLVTSGQPSAQALANLSQLGFRAVVYLAPSTVPDAVKDEAQIVAAQGLEFVHIPIPFSDPTEDHFHLLRAVLQRLHGQKVLVHCQVNMRASTMVFLYRVINNGESPALAWESVTRVWSPAGPWKRLTTKLLAKHGVDFEAF